MDIALTRSNKNCPNQLFFNIFNSIFLWPLRHIGRVLWATNMLRLGIPRKFSRYRSPVHTLTMPKDRLAAIYPLGRIVTTEEVANAALFLASPLASGITGTSLTVDAGLMAGNLPFLTAIS